MVAISNHNEEMNKIDISKKEINKKLEYHMRHIKYCQEILKILNKRQQNCEEKWQLLLEEEKLFEKINNTEDTFMNGNDHHQRVGMILLLRCFAACRKRR